MEDKNEFKYNKNEQTQLHQLSLHEITCKIGNRSQAIEFCQEQGKIKYIFFRFLFSQLFLLLKLVSF